MGERVKGSGRRFRVQRCLGRGGFGEVYRATMAGEGGLEADVALKVLRRDLDPRGQAARRLRDEGRLLSRLHHPSILRVYDIVELDGRVALVTEFVDGEDLGALLLTDPPPPRVLVEITGLVAGALDAAWNTPADDGSPLHLVHRDIKPSNIRVGVHGAVKLLDFGISRAESVEREARTQTDLLVGSPAYMAPERFLDASLDPASDVFALGATLYEGLAGRRFHADLAVPQIAGLAIAPERYEDWLAERLRALAGVEPVIVDLVRAMLDYAPERRPVASEVATRCDQLLDAVRGESLSTWARRHGWHEATHFAGELEGRVLTEGALAPSPEPTPRARRPRATRAAVGAVLMAVILSAPFALGRLPAPSWILEPTPVPVSARPPEAGFGTPPPSRPVVPRERRMPDPVVPETADPDLPDPPPGTADPPPRALPEAKAPAPPAPAPAPAERPAPADPLPEAPATARLLTGRVDLTGDASEVHLRGPGGLHRVPGEIPEGEYEVLAVFAGREVHAGQLVVRAGGVHQLSCAGRMFRCEGR